uniref:Uncharacterized protein n=1 Tax=Oryza sativa subsp. japonica TaxID=39947 RepID=Q5VRF9_ORYSJ|nr:hypothetical protein [Oryza sativa Japonica Group]BAD67966.1 hypothetical protein [Oryza sativa Japonica Group]
MPKRLDPELVHSLYLNCKKDQLVIYIDGERRPPTPGGNCLATRARFQVVPCDPPLGNAAPAEVPSDRSIETVDSEF